VLHRHFAQFFTTIARISDVSSVSEDQKSALFGHDTDSKDSVDFGARWSQRQVGLISSKVVPMAPPNHMQKILESG